MTRAYFVCKKCGPSSWIFQDRVGANPFCQKCGCQWPKPKPQQPNAIAGADWANRDQARVWKNKGPKATKDRAGNAPVGAAQRALVTVWDSLPGPAQQAIELAGWQPRPPASPPGLGGKGNQSKQEGVRPSKGGSGKGHGASGGAEAEAVRVETAKALFASASDEQRALLIQLGIKAPEEPQPDLTALCKQHMSSLPADIRKLVEDPPEKPPTAQELMSEKSKQFKVATTELRELIFKKSSLQLRLDKHKELFTSMLADMKVINETLEARQKLVSSLQLELQSSVAAVPTPEALPEATESLAKQVEAMDVDQLDDYKQRVIDALEEAVKRRRTEAPAAKPLPAQEAPAGPGQAGEAMPAGEGKDRSRSRGRAQQG